MDISKLEIEALKALAYDFLTDLDRINKNLQAVNLEIQKRNQTPPTKTPGSNGKS